MRRHRVRRQKLESLSQAKLRYPSQSISNHSSMRKSNADLNVPFIRSASLSARWMFLISSSDT